MAEKLLILTLSNKHLFTIFIVKTLLTILIEIPSNLY